jgi:hypothetical protein
MTGSRRIVAAFLTAWAACAGLRAAEDGPFEGETSVSGPARAAVPPEAVYDGCAPSYHEWRLAALRHNLEAADRVKGESVGSVRLRLKGGEAREEVFLAEARRRAAAAGANMLCAERSGGAKRGAMVFELVRVEHEGRPVPPMFLLLLASATFRDDAQLESLLTRWDTVHPASAPRAVPPPPAVVAAVAAPSPPPAVPAETLAPAAAAVVPPAPVPASPVEKEAKPPVEEEPASGEEAKPPVPEEPADGKEAELPDERELVLRKMKAPDLPPTGKTPPLPAGLKAAKLPEPKPVEMSGLPDAPALKPIEPKPPRGAESESGEGTKSPGRASRAGFLSLLVPGLGQAVVEGDKAGGARAFLVQVLWAAGSSVGQREFRAKVERGLDDVYAYKAARFGLGTAWVAQSAALTLRLWPGIDEEPDDVGGAVSRSMLVPGWGLLHAGRYELGLNVMAWEGFAWYWGSKAELRRQDRVALVAWTHWTQAVLTGWLVSSGGGASSRAGRAADVTVAVEPRDGGTTFALRRRFGGLRPVSTR